MSKKFTVVHIITSSDIGGAQQHVQDLVTNLNKDKFNPVVICGRGGDFADRLRVLGVQAHQIESLDKKINLALDFKTLVALMTLIKKLKPAIVHTHSSKAGLLGRLAAKLCGVPVVIFTAHGFVFHEHMSKLKYYFYLYLEKLAGLITDQIIAVSELDKSKAINNRIISADAVETVHNGIDLEKFKPVKNSDFIKLQKQIHVYEDEILIGLVGRLVEEKGIPDFIEAAKIISSSYPQTKFVLVGDGPLRSFLEDLAEQNGLSNNFIFTGVREDVKLLLSVMDIVVFTSIKEGLPLALLEALAMEKPVVSTRAGGIPEVITSGLDGLLTPVGDPSAVAKAIINLVENVDLRKELGTRGRLTVKERFTINQMVEKTQWIYLRLLEKKRIRQTC